MSLNSHKSFLLVLLLSVAVGCNDNKVSSSVEIESSDSLPTLVSEQLDIKHYDKGGLAYKFSTKLLERYMLVDSPYMEFTKGVHIETFDSLKNITTLLDAEYAKYNEKAQLWEARGNVVARDSIGKTLYTEKLFWDEKKREVYSPVTTRVVNGDEITVGSGFKSDDKLENIQFTRTRGRILVDTAKTSEPLVDTTATDSTNNKKN